MEALWNCATAKIRTVDKNTLIFFEGATFDILSGFNNVPLGDGSRSVHSFHYYNPPQLGSISDTLNNCLKKSIRLKTAGMLTEFTFWLTDDAGSTKLQDTVNAADEHMMSWMGWAYENVYDGNGFAHPGLTKHYSRAYTAVVAGIPSKFTFNPSDSSFSLTYNVKKSVNAPFEIGLHIPTYPNGYNVSITPSIVDVVQYKLNDRTLAIFNNDSITEGHD